LRFSNPLYAISAIVALLGATLGTLVSVYSDIRIKIPFTFRSISTIGLFLEILPQLIILLWALAFAWMALSDIRRFRQVVVYPKSSVNSQTKDI
jgi:type II secretory pathway component PulF